jgi:hypothetical protein
MLGRSPALDLSKAPLLWRYIQQQQLKIPNALQNLSGILCLLKAAPWLFILKVSILPYQKQKTFHNMTIHHQVHQKSLYVLGFGIKALLNIFLA